MKLKDFYHLSVPGDGGCFFHAIASILYYEKNPTKLKNPRFTFEKESMKIRRKAVKWLKDNLNYVIKGTGLTISMEIEDAIQIEPEDAKREDNRKIRYKTFDEYLKFMSKNSSYTGQIEIYAVSEILQRNIRVFTSKNKKNPHERLNNMGLGYELKKLSYSTLPSSKDIYLYHNFGKGGSKGSHHFEPLIPKNKIGLIVSKKTKRTRQRRVTRNSVRRIRKDTRRIRKDTRSIKKDTRRIRKHTRRIKKDTRRIRKDTRRIRKGTRRIRKDTRRKTNETRKRDNRRNTKRRK